MAKLFDHFYASQPRKPFYSACSSDKQSGYQDYNLSRIKNYEFSGNCRLATSQFVSVGTAQTNAVTCVEVKIRTLINLFKQNRRYKA